MRKKEIALTAIERLKERYPDVKNVCIIGDYLSTGIERSTLAIARHYGGRSCKTEQTAEQEKDKI